MNWLLRVDRTLYEWIVVIGGNPSLQQFCEDIARPSTLAPFLLILWVGYFLMKPKRAVIFLFLSFLLLAFGDFFVNMLKNLVGRNRPGVELFLYYNPTAFGWPSAHAFNSMSFGVFAWLWSRKQNSYFILLSFIIGIARVISNYHFPVDVIAGWFLGCFFGWGFYTILEERLQRAVFVYRARW